MTTMGAVRGMLPGISSAFCRRCRLGGPPSLSLSSPPCPPPPASSPSLSGAAAATAATASSTKALQPLSSVSPRLLVGRFFSSRSSSANSAAGLLRCSLPRRLFSPAPLQSFHHDSKILELPSPGKAPRPFQGLDMRKIQDNPWVNVWVTRRNMETGYQWGNYGGPSIHAPTMEEVASFFDCSHWKEKYTWKEMAQAAYPQLRILLMFVGAIAIPLVPCVGYIFQQQRYEPMEVTVPSDEFFQHYRWHYFGPELDHHGFTAYLEARRAKRWRKEDVDPERWIPPHYLNDDGGPERKKHGGGGRE